MNSKLNSPFDPDSGIFMNNIRSLTGCDDTELRESLKQFGWVREFPAIQDENGVTIVGHRRLQVAAELNIDPVISRIVFGDGDRADAKRLRLALASNLGSAPMTAKDRQQIAKYLYGQRGWDMRKIGKALDVSHVTISRDLEGVVTDRNNLRPKGGRPKGVKDSKSRQASKPRGPRRVDITADKRQQIADAYLDGGRSQDQLAREFGVSVQIVKTAVAAERAARAQTVTPVRRERVNEYRADPTKLSDKLLTREQVDPDFKGDAGEFLDKYGHVNIMTAAERVAADISAAASIGIGVLKMLKPIDDLKFLKDRDKFGKVPERDREKIRRIVAELPAYVELFEEINEGLKS